MNVAPCQKRALARSRNQGAALVVGLILLMVLTLLAVSSMNTSTLELQMAGNAQYGESAFQAAEYGIERAFHSGIYSTSADEEEAEENALEGAVTTGKPETYHAVTSFDPDTGVTPVPSGGYSIGVGTGFSAYHFDITSNGASSRNATATNTQSFFVVGPSGT